MNPMRPTRSVFVGQEVSATLSAVCTPRGLRALRAARAQFTPMGRVGALSALTYVPLRGEPRAARV